MELYVIPEAEATIVLDDGPFAGAEVEVRLNVPYSAVREHRRLWREWAEAERNSDEEHAAYVAVCRVFADEGLVAWNLADKRGPIPATNDGMLRLPQPVAITIMRTWRGSIGVVSPPLPQSSPSIEAPSTSTNGSSPDGTPDPETPMIPGSPSTP